MVIFVEPMEGKNVYKKVGQLSRTFKADISHRAVNNMRAGAAARECYCARVNIKTCCNFRTASSSTSRNFFAFSGVAHSDFLLPRRTKPLCTRAGQQLVNLFQFETQKLVVREIIVGGFSTERKNIVS